MGEVRIRMPDSGVIWQSPGTVETSDLVILPGRRAPGGAGMACPRFLPEGPQRLRGQGRPEGPSRQRCAAALSPEGRAPTLPGAPRDTRPPTPPPTPSP